MRSPSEAETRVYARTFIPSNTDVPYCKHELAGSKFNGPYGLISGGAHPLTGSYVHTSIWSDFV